jgi:ketol-acid reductoisomerase
MRKVASKKSLIRNLRKYKISVLGYGSQGRAQALNLRDSGILPLIGLPSGSKSRKTARADGFEIATPQRAVKRCDIIVVLIPDHKHKELFDGFRKPQTLSGKALIFAHGFSIAFGPVKPPADCDVILIAPHGPGLRLRENYINGEPFTAFRGIENDHSGKALQIARAYAAAIGCPEANLFPSTFMEEAVGDIFGEQAVLCGGLVGLMESGFDTLVKKGHSRRSAYLECIYQLDLLIDLVIQFGPAGMFERISKTAAFGSLKRKEFLFDSEFRRKMQALYDDIKNGGFARTLTKEDARGMAGLLKMLKVSRESSLQKTHDSLPPELKGRRRKSGHRRRGGEQNAPKP